MRKVKYTARPFIARIIMSGILITVIGGVMAAGGCTNTIGMPHKLIPAYAFEIQFPADEKNVGTLTMEPGTTVILPVVVRSLSDVPISIRLTQGEANLSPDFIALHGPDDYTVLQPGDNITLAVTCAIAPNAAPGNYQAEISGELEKPVPDRSLMSEGFRIIIANKEAER
jgi:hypothetical protein